MNKSSRKSGGIPLRKIPPVFEKYLGYVNEIALFVDDPQITNPRFFDLPQPPSMYDPQVIIDTFTVPMKQLEIILRIISPEFAMDILRSSYFFADKSDQTLTKLLDNHDAAIFRPELGDEGTKIYLDCLRRYVGFDSLYYFLDDLVFNWRHKKDETELFFEDTNNFDKTFPIKSRFVNWNESFSLSVSAKRVEQRKLRFHIQLKVNQWVEVLQDLEIDRVRRCKYCRKFFWAERSDQSGCSDCCSSKKTESSDSLPESRKRGQRKIDSERKRNLKIKREVEAQPPFVYEYPEEELIEAPPDQSLLGKTVLKDGELYDVVEIRNNLQVLEPKKRLGLIKKAFKRVKEFVWGN